MSWTNSNGDFDLDNPFFQTPQAIISGLASGYCERKAAVDETFSAAAWVDDNIKSATVSNFAENIMLTQSIGVSSSYPDPNSEFFINPKKWVEENENKTFMDYFDNDLTSMSSKYVQRGGTAYDGFAGLAFAASARASSDVEDSDYSGYAPTTLAISGGSSVNFSPIYDIDWACKRRDMLEDLRYVSQALVEINNTGTGGAKYYWDYAYGSLLTSDSYQMVGIGGGTGTEHYLPYIVSCNLDYPYQEQGGSGEWLFQYDMTCRMFTDSQTASCAIFLGNYVPYGMGGPIYDYRNTEYTKYIADGEVSNTISGSNYCVLSGGTLIGSSTNLAGTIMVESGGVFEAHGKNICANLVNIYDGGIVIPYTSGNMIYPYADEICYNHDHDDILWFEGQNSCVYISGTTATNPTNTKMYIDSNSIVKLTNFCSCAEIHGGELVLSNNGSCDLLVVNKNGIVHIEGGIVESVTILSGGTAVLNNAVTSSVLTMHVCSGGSVIINSLSPSDATSVIKYLHLFDGCYISINSNILNNAAIGDFLYDVSIYHFCTLGIFGDSISSQTNPGWIILNATSNTTGYGQDYFLFNVDSTTISSYIKGNPDGLLALGSNVSGGIINGGIVSVPIEKAIINDPERLLKIYYGSLIKAFNSKGATIDKYPEFIYRKFGDEHK